RHTISKRDWSSDVCSSDLFCPVPQGTLPKPIKRNLSLPLSPGEFFIAHDGLWQRPLRKRTKSLFFKGSFLLRVMGFGSVPCRREIGRAQCRVTVWCRDWCS